MGFYTFERKIELSTDIEKLWDFITNPVNLKLITPDYMSFDITSKLTSDRIYEGMIISYIVTPLAGIKIKWVTEITHIKELEYFVDEQRVGPYKMWHHQHFLSRTEKGTLMTDIVSYKPPFGVIDSLANSIIIHKKLNEIFDYRKNIVSDLFGIV